MGMTPETSSCGGRRGRVWGWGIGLASSRHGGSCSEHPKRPEGYSSTPGRGGLGLVSGGGARPSWGRPWPLLPRVSVSLGRGALEGRTSETPGPLTVTGWVASEAPGLSQQVSVALRVPKASVPCDTIACSRVPATSPGTQAPAEGRGPRLAAGPGAPWGGAAPLESQAHRTVSWEIARPGFWVDRRGGGVQVPVQSGRLPHPTG